MAQAHKHSFEIRGLTPLLSLAYPETLLVMSLPDDVYPDTNVYTIRLLSLNEVEVSQGGLTNVSTTMSAGFRAFFKNP
jgi:hypothetical protein